MPYRLLLCVPYQHFIAAFFVDVLACIAPCFYGVCPLISEWKRRESVHHLLDLVMVGIARWGHLFIPYRRVPPSDERTKYGWDLQSLYLYK